MQNITSASPGQTFALFCASGYDVRGCTLSRERASELLDSSKRDVAATIRAIAALPGAVFKREIKPKQDWQALYDKARAAGLAAGNGATVTPMVVCQHENVADDSSPVAKSYFVADGVCGFAWITIRPGNCSFAKWLAANDLARKSYGGGVSIWVHEFNQSLSRKEVFAHAFADVLSEAGIKATPGSRMD